MKAKRWLTGALATAMILAMAAPAFAETPAANDVNSATQKIVISGEATHTPTIKLTVANSGAVALNPYQMVVPASAEEGADTVQDQVISAMQTIESNSNVALKADVTVTGAIPSGSNAVFKATTTKTTTTTTTTTTAPKNEVFMYFDVMAAETDEDGNVAEPEWAAYNSKSTSQVVVKVGDTKKSDVVTLPAADYTDPEAIVPTYAAFHVTGDVNSKATWTANDKVDVTIAFTFKPQLVDIVAGGEDDNG